MQKYIVANWKSNKTDGEVREWLKTFKPFFKKFAASSSVQVVLCPSFIHLGLIHQELPELLLGTQTLSSFPPGAYTGEVSASMAKDYAGFALLGHVERHQFFNETDQMVANQALQALESGMTPIVAVNDLNWSSQLSQLGNDHLAKCLVMYEPPEAISVNGQSNPAELEKVLAAAKQITESYPVKGVLYGGSVTAENVGTFMNETSLAGVVPGFASLDVLSFIQLLQPFLATK